MAPRAKYALLQTASSTYSFQIDHYAVVELDTGLEIAHFDWFGFRGGWAEKFIGHFGDAGPASYVAECSDESRDRHKRVIHMLHATLEPAH